MTNVRTATAAATVANVHAGVHEARAARDGHGGVEAAGATAAAGGSERLGGGGNMRVTRAMKRAREGGGGRG